LLYLSVFSRHLAHLNMLSDRLLSCSVDGRLFYTVGLWKAKLHWPTNVLPSDINRASVPVIIYM